MNIPPIFVVSLERCPERRAAMHHRLSSAGLEYQFFSGVDGKKLKKSDYGHRWRGEWWRVMRGRQLSPGEIGCFLSHWNLWEQLVLTQTSCAIVLEDDCILSDDFAAVVAEILAVEWKWDIVLLSARKRYAIDKMLCKIGDNGRRLVRFKRRVGTTGAYLIHLHAARRLVDYCYEIRAPIDWCYAEWWLNKLAFYAVSPGITKSDPVPSIIGVPPKERRVLSEHITALRYRIWGWVNRHWYRWTNSPQKKGINDESGEI